MPFRPKSINHQSQNHQSRCTVTCTVQRVAPSGRLAPSVYVPTTVWSPVSCRGRDIEFWRRCCPLLQYPHSCCCLFVRIYRISCCCTVPAAHFLCAVIDKRSGCAHTASHSVTHSSTESSSRAADGQDDKGRTLAQAKAHLHMMSACHIPHTGIF